MLFRTAPIAASLALALAAAPAVAQDAASGPEACTVRDTNGMITLVICPEGLGAADLQVAGQAACEGREPCLAWIWDNPEVAPVTAPASGPSSHKTARAISAGSTSRRSAAGRVSSVSASAPEAKAASSAGVRVKPGETALTRTPRGPHSAARVVVRFSTAALAGP